MLVLQALALFTKEHLQSIVHDDSLPIRAEYCLENNQESTKVTVTYPAPQIQAVMSAHDYGLQEAGQAHVHSALKLVDQAWEADDPLTRVQMAQEALTIWPDCIEAFLVLGVEAESIEGTLQFFQQGVQAAERALDHQAIDQYIGRIWDLRMVRAHLDARQGVLECLMSLEDYNKAKLAADELLEINPMDDQGIRYSLLFILTQLKNDQALRQLLDNYSAEVDCHWLYTRALLEFRQKGDSRKSRLLIQDAINQNPFVPEYLTGERLIPDELPENEGIDDEIEAVYYARNYFNTWWQTKGALAWLRQNIV
jgi:tetratricopeptide (TPR) repeat protein